MLAIVGIVIVIGAVLGGYVMEGGHIGVLFQPAEFVIIGGAAIGAMLTGTPVKLIKGLFQQLLGLLKSGPTRASYLQLLVTLYELLNIARKDGIVALEKHIEDPEQSSVLGKNPDLLKDHHALTFLVDTLRLIVSGSGVEPHDLEALMDVDLEAHHKESTGPSKALNVIGDSLPGLGIVAAVLGIVITMGAIDGPPEEIGHKVGAALVGTFLGILLAYGFLGPLASAIAARNEELGQVVVVIKQVLLAFHKGTHPAIAVEFARRGLFSDVRPEFTELEKACRASGKPRAEAA